MSDRLAAAVAELVDALRAELATEARPAAVAPVELLSVAEFARRVGIGRSTAYLAVADGSLRTVKVRGRRLVPASEVDRLAGSANRPVSAGGRRRRAGLPHPTAPPE